jgi:GGDEF domain-containing protein
MSLAEDSVATEKAVRQDLLTYLTSHFAFENFEGVLERLTRWGEDFAALTIGFDRSKEVNDPLGHSAETTMLRKAAMIISDSPRAPAPQIEDLHDVTGHHRYYGSAAYLQTSKLVS